MKYVKLLLLIAALSVSISCIGCTDDDDVPSDDLASYLNETNAVIEAGDVYDAYILINGEPELIQLMRVWSNQGYNVDYPLEYFEYYTNSGANYLTDSGSDCFVWSLDNQASPQNYVEICRLSESMSNTADRLEQQLSLQFANVGRAAVQFNVCTAELLCCTDPTDDSLPTDTLLDCYIVHSNDGCRVIEVHYTHDSVDSIYPYLKALLDEVQLSVG